MFRPARDSSVCSYSIKLHAGRMTWSLEQETRRCCALRDLGNTNLLALFVCSQRCKFVWVKQMINVFRRRLAAF